MADVIFPPRVDDRTAVRIGDTEIRLGPGLEFAIHQFEREVITPCDDGECPFKKAPQDIDACVESCPDRQEGESLGRSTLGTGESLEDIEGSVKQLFRQTAGRRYGWGPSADQFLSPWVFK